jgi:hypothetical protein
LIHATLQGGTARVIVNDDTPERSVIERDASSDKPTVYVGDVVVVDEPELLSEIEIYSQGELQEIAEDSAKSLALVDRPHKSQIRGWLREIQETSEKVSAIGPRLRDLRDSIESAEDVLQEGKPVEEELARVRKERPEMSAEMSDLRVAHERGQRLLETAEQIAASYKDAAESLAEAADEVVATARDSEELGSSGDSDLEAIAKKLAESDAALVTMKDGLVDSSELAALVSSAQEKFVEASEPYREALRQEKVVIDSLKQEDRLLEEAKKLEAIAADLEKKRRAEAELRQERDDLRGELRNLRENIYELRLAEVERMNVKFSEKVVLALQQGTRTDKYKEHLNDLLDRSRIRDRARICDELAAAFPPEALVTLVEEEDSTTLSSTLGRDAGQMMRVVSHFGSGDGIFEIEKNVPDDELDVTMFVENEARSVSEMSKGQKATAILPLLLREAEYPLILDQPEDDLDNRFIFEYMVEQIKALKETRQLIFVTHNANIPVIGEADRVIAMGMEGPSLAEITAAGKVDEMRDPIVELLEGGEEAFERRSQVYRL